MKLQELFENLEDDHEVQWSAFQRLKSKMSAADVDEFSELDDSFREAYDDNDPYGNSPEDYLDRMADIMGKYQ